MRYEITHKTHYQYGDTVPECFNLVRLNPRPVAHQACLSHEVKISPRPSTRSTRVDFFGNHIEHFAIHEPHAELSVESLTEVVVSAPSYPTAAATPNWKTVADMSLREDLVVAQLRYPSRHIRTKPEFAEYARVSFEGDRTVLGAAIHLMGRIHDDFIFDTGATTVSTPVETVFEKRAGVCQDFAHFQIACLRSLNIPARYVSGYLRTLPPPGRARLVGADASHAWVSVYCGEGEDGDVWVDLDPTNNVIPTTDHTTLGWGRDYADVCPIQGVFTGGGATLLRVEVDVAPQQE